MHFILHISSKAAIGRINNTPTFKTKDYYLNNCVSLAIMINQVPRHNLTKLRIDSVSNPKQRTNKVERRLYPFEHKGVLKKAYQAKKHATQNIFAMAYLQ